MQCYRCSWQCWRTSFVYCNCKCSSSPAPPAVQRTSIQDTTPPVIDANIEGTLGNTGWYTSDVTVSWTVTDPQSQITSKSKACYPTITINQDTAIKGQTITCEATSAGGTTTKSVTINRDATHPVLTMPKDMVFDATSEDGIR